MRIFIVAAATLVTVSLLDASPMRAIVGCAPRNFSFIDSDYPFASTNPYGVCRNCNPTRAGSAYMHPSYMPHSMIDADYEMDPYTNYAMAIDYYKQLYREIKKRGSKAEAKKMKKMIKRLKHGYY